MTRVEHIYGEVKVLEEMKAAGPYVIIRFPSQVCNVEQAEAFMCNLIDAITKAREIVGDPL